MNIQTPYKQVSGKSTAKAKGTHLIEIARCTSDFAMKMVNLIEYNAQNRLRLLLERAKTGINIEIQLIALWEEYRFFIEQLNRKYKVRELVVENITTTVGRAALIDRLVATNVYSGNVTHCALGTGATAAVVGDTVLDTETYRKALTAGTKNNNIGILETFFTPAEVSGTFEEYGYFIAGTGSADSGQLFNRFLQTVTKSATESLNVQSTVTLSDA